jgi:ATP-dependent RNA helicase DeaD
VNAVEALGYKEPTAIQAQCLPLLLEGQDLIGQAQTGTGKTAAFALPLIQNLPKKKRRPPTPSALVLAPTRELAIQVATSVTSYGGAHFESQVALLYGGQPIGPQIGALKRQPAIVIGTPGRVIDHLTRGTLDLSETRFVVLDEADEMLKMGFIEDVSHILSHTHPERQSALFSATMPPEVKRIADQYLRPERAHIRVEGGRRTSDDVEQFVLHAPREGKVAALAALLELTLEGVRIVFARTRQDTTNLVDALARFGHQAEALNGEMGQQLREAVINRLREGTLNTLVATDVAARGLDIDNVSLVVNFDLPFDSESYIHRVGRTGRAGQRGLAVSLADPRDSRSLFHLQRKLSQTLKVYPPIHPDALLAARKEALKRELIMKLDQDAAQAAAQKAHKAQPEGEAEEKAESTEVQVSPYHEVVYELLEEGRPLQEVAAAAIALVARERPLERKRLPLRFDPSAVDPRKARKERRREERNPRHRDERGERGERPPRAPRAPRAHGEMISVELNIGHKNRVRPKDLVGAIANEGRIEGRQIGAITIEERRSLVELPPEVVERVMQRVAGRFICGVKVKMRLAR